MRNYQGIDEESARPFAAGGSHLLLAVRSLELVLRVAGEERA